MKRSAFFIALVLVVASLGADSFTPHEDIKFDIVINKTGSQQLYFADPGTWNVPKMEATHFQLLTGEATTVTIDLGVFWSIFPESESASESIGVDIQLLASSSSEYEQDSSEGYMLDLQKESTSGAPIGLNYSIDVYEVGEDGMQGNFDRSLEIPDEEITIPLAKDSRMLSLFKDNVTASGNTGKRLLKLTLNPPTTEDGRYYMEGDYQGYLILHVETY